MKETVVVELEKNDLSRLMNGDPYYALGSIQKAFKEASTVICQDYHRPAHLEILYAVLHLVKKRTSMESTIAHSSKEADKHVYTLAILSDLEDEIQKLIQPEIDKINKSRYKAWRKNENKNEMKYAHAIEKGPSIEVRGIGTWIDKDGNIIPGGQNDD